MDKPTYRHQSVSDLLAMFKPDEEEVISFTEAADSLQAKLSNLPYCSSFSVAVVPKNDPYYEFGGFGKMFNRVLAAVRFVEEEQKRRAESPELSREQISELWAHLNDLAVKVNNLKAESSKPLLSEILPLQPELVAEMVGESQKRQRAWEKEHAELLANQIQALSNGLDQLIKMMGFVEPNPPSSPETK